MKVREKYICEYCGREFPTDYAGKTIMGDWKHNAQLAQANFNKHKKSCKRKHNEQ